MAWHDYQNVRLAVSLDSLTIRALEHRTDDAGQAMILPARRTRFWSSVGGLSVVILATAAIVLIR
jgi:hypothetical protein